ncbi:hypothetical protein C8A00DRAFT_15503 [Chaetomidium leptoderma]|uniref:Uncharacterized protein n=1 Tax=Chaetomidium leptoderma TaxID=669021 RepID=A0AAN6VL61_9PEZI|nr:hypothetical protein C8A00DRAFT_15503 [Chaetomidium leptoderma]
MEVGVTFGSLGDIIVVCQIAIQLGRAICDSQHGSAKAYQGLREELGMFVKILMQVVATYPQHEFTPYLAGLDTTAKSIVNECGTLIQEALDRWHKKYHQSLSPGGSGNPLKDAGKKMEWFLREQDRMKELQERLSRGTQRLTLLGSLAARKSARADNATMLARVDEVKRLVSQSHEVQVAMLHLSRDHSTQLYALGEKVEKQEETGSAVLSQAKGTFRIVLEVKEMVNQLCKTVADIQLLLSSRTITKSLDPTKNLPLIVEDALGNIMEIPLDLVHSWEVSTCTQPSSRDFKSVSHGRPGFRLSC